MKPYYEDDHVTLYHGDCLEISEWWANADVLVTDPPYGIDWKGVANYSAGGIRRATNHKWGGIHGDESVEVRDQVLEKWGTRPALVFGS